MDFGDTEWHSDVKTDRLVTSLFGPLSSTNIYKHEDVSRRKTTQEARIVKDYRHRHTSRKSANECESISDTSFKKTKRKIKQPDSRRDRAGDSVQNVMSKKKKLKSSVFEGSQCNLEEIKRDRLDKLSEENKNKKHSFSLKDTTSESMQKSPTKRKRPCRRNKYKHLAHTDGVNNSSISPIQDSHITDSNTVESTKLKIAEDKMSTDQSVFKHLDKFLNKIMKHSKKERSSLPFKTVKHLKKERCSLQLNLPDGKDGKRKNGNVSEEVLKTQSNRKDERNEAVKMPKHKKGASLFISQKTQNNKDKIMTVRKSVFDTNNCSISSPVKSGKRKLFSKQKKSGLVENLSPVDKDVIFSKHSVATKQKSGVPKYEPVTKSSKTTARKTNLPFNVEKLKMYLDKNKTQQTEKIDKKLKRKQQSISKTADAAPSRMNDFKSTDNNSISLKHLEKFAQTKKPKSHLSLQEKLRNQLSSARFRYLSEQMYTQTGSEAQTLFVGDKEAFRVYHDGYQAQVSKWPLSPLSVIIEEIKTGSPDLIVADFGCGEAILAQSIPNTVYSFDLVALNKRVTACDMSKVPLNNNSVDVTVFCLSLMGTNLTDYLCEASRVLKKGGLLKIAEVASRFEKTSKFARNVERMGFQLSNKNTANKMFYLFDFVKVGNVKKDLLPQIQLNPCLYKKR